MHGSSREGLNTYILPSLSNGNTDFLCVCYLVLVLYICKCFSLLPYCFADHNRIPEELQSLQVIQYLGLFYLLYEVIYLIYEVTLNNLQYFTVSINWTIKIYYLLQKEYILLYPKSINVSEIFVLDSFRSTWHKLESSERMEPELRKCP